MSETTERGVVKVARAANEAEAEFLQGLLSDAGVRSLVRRAPGFDVPDFLAAGPRDVLVDARDVATAREVLRTDDAVPPPQLPARASTRVKVAVLAAAAVVAGAVCVALDVVP